MDQACKIISEFNRNLFHMMSQGLQYLKLYLGLDFLLGIGACHPRLGILHSLGKTLKPKTNEYLAIEILQLKSLYSVYIQLRLLVDYSISSAH